MISPMPIIREGDRYPRLVIYIIYAHQLHGLLTGEAKITNLPEGFQLYKVVPWMNDQCDNALAVWLSHPDFEEVPWGNLVRTDYLLWEEVKGEKCQQLKEAKALPSLQVLEQEALDLADMKRPISGMEADRRPSEY